MNEIAENITHLHQPFTETDSLVLGYSAVVSTIKPTATGLPVYQVSIDGNIVSAEAVESLLVSPIEGDLVLCAEIKGELFITQVLKRKQKSKSLMIQSSRPVEWVAPVLRFKALKEMELLSANKLTISACDLVLGACRSLVQQAHNFIQNATTYSLTTKGLMRLSGKQQLVVAEEDLRMDAKRINMG